MNTIRHTLNSYSGCMLGGAIGDALGAPVEFLSADEIFRTYGEHGVSSYVENSDGKGEITDDTQMMLFTAEGLLRSTHRAMIKGITGAEINITHASYLRWLHTQEQSGPGREQDDGWLINVAGLYSRRAPGLTCLNALHSGKYGTIQDPLNNSKGCGGIMRTAPVGLIYYNDAEKAFRSGCELAAITHGHATGYLSSGSFAAIISFLVQGYELSAAISSSMLLLRRMPDHQETVMAMERAMELPARMEPSYKAVEELGRGWVAEEALAIALYCSLVHESNFEEGVLLAVNHGGDSDSTGTLTGNILGLITGERQIPRRWKDDLLLAEIVEEIAKDLYVGVRGNSFDQDPDWVRRYPPF